MRTKKVNRYWCDFCNKAGLQSRAIVKHEAHCTLNPARDCRVCGLMGGSVKVGVERMAGLVAILPGYVEYNGDGWGNPTAEYVAFCKALPEAIPALRAATNNCPACIMAALRQAKIPVPMVGEFDFKAEMQTVLADNARVYGDDY
jgi:hypothetical protein